MRGLGSCDSGTKAKHAQSAGAVALLVSTSVRVGMGAGTTTFHFCHLTPRNSSKQRWHKRFDPSFRHILGQKT